MKTPMRRLCSTVEQELDGTAVCLGYVPTGAGTAASATRLSDPTRTRRGRWSRR
jgi:hypothetical protein